MPEAMVDEGELARDVAHQLEHLAAARRHVPRLHAADRRAGGRTEVHRVELLAHDVERARVRRACSHDVASSPSSVPPRSVSATASSVGSSGRPLKTTMSGAVFIIFR